MCVCESEREREIDRERERARAASPIPFVGTTAAWVLLRVIVLRYRGLCPRVFRATESLADLSKYLSERAGYDTQ